MDDTALQHLVSGLRDDHGAPGIVAAVCLGGQRAFAAAGTANAASGEPMGVETGFLFGSVTKVWVTTLLMQLVDERLLSLDQRVTEVLPAFRTADPSASAQLTIRHLVTHTSGIDGADYCPDHLGRGPESVSRYVESLRDLGQLHEPGQYWSYCNPGFVIAGRVVEVVTGLDFDDAFRQRLVAPLGLERTFLTPEESIMWPAAVGHFPDPAGGFRPTARYLLPHSLGPAGTALSTTVADALTFADVHLGRRTGVLSVEGLAAMASHQVDLPASGLGGFGLGWARSLRNGTVVLSHGGGSIGGLAQLIAVPDRDLALVAFVNSATGSGLMVALIEAVLGGEGLPRDPTDPGQPGDAGQFVGTYRRHGFDVDITVDGDDLVVRETPDPTNAVLQGYEAAAPSEVRCRPIGPRSFGLPPQASGAVASAMGALVDDDYLYLGGRLVRRVAV
jgi:CubicO group peptidase (beta-lactamase class C family)